jgi:predicted  nucleic acid-binding Zn-ribbon protein
VKIEATAKEIRALLELAGADEEAGPADAEARQGRRHALTRRVPRRLLEAYQLLLEVGRLPAAVPIERGACSGCHVRLPTVLDFNARRSAAIHRCPRCRRLLYVPELVRPESARDPRASREDAVASRKA